MSNDARLDRFVLPAFVESRLRTARLVTGAATKLANVARRAQVGTIAADIGASAQSFVDYQPTIVVMGGFKAGKSTLINELLNSNGSPYVKYATVSPVPITKRIVRYEYAPEVAVHLRDEAGRERELPAGELSQGQAMTSDSPVEEVRANANVELRVFVPAEVVRCGIALVDTPGLAGNDQRWFLDSLLASADVVLYVIRASVFGARSDFELIEQIRNQSSAELCTVINIDHDQERDSRFIEFVSTRLLRRSIEAGEAVPSLEELGVLTFNAAGRRSRTGHIGSDVQHILHRLDNLLARSVQPRRAAAILHVLDERGSLLREHINRRVALVESEEGIHTGEAGLMLAELPRHADRILRTHLQHTEDTLVAELRSVVRDLELSLNNAALADEVLSGASLWLADSRRMAVERLFERCANEASDTLHRWWQGRVPVIVENLRFELREEWHRLLGDQLGQEAKAVVWDPMIQPLIDAFAVGKVARGVDQQISSVDRLVKGGSMPAGAMIGAMFGLATGGPIGALIGASALGAFSTQRALRAAIRDEIVPVVVRRTQEAGMSGVQHLLNEMNRMTAEWRELVERWTADQMGLMRQISSEVASRREAATEIRKELIESDLAIEETLGSIRHAIKNE